jgi:hypothetical protein
MPKSISHSISALVALYEPRVRRPQGLICHAMWILVFIILFIIYYQAKIGKVNKDKILKYLTADLFVMMYFFIVTSFIIHVCIFCTCADIDMHFLHDMQIWVIVMSPISRLANYA